MTTLRTAAQQALEALEFVRSTESLGMVTDGAAIAKATGEKA